MSVCCDTAVGLADTRQAPAPAELAGARDLSAWIQVASGETGETATPGSAAQTWELHLMVEGVTCGGCIQRIEGALTADSDVTHARLNLSTRRLTVRWTATEAGSAAKATDLVARVERLGYRLVPYAPQQLGAADAQEERDLLRSMAVAGFAAANVMLLSVSVWAGLDGSMGEATRDLMHWVSALIALPAVVYAGRPFYRSAWQALRGGGLNMEVPIALAVLLAAGMSLFETMQGGDHVYFDSAVTLLFFLLIGRFLDRRGRARARAAAERLLALGATAATVLDADGQRKAVPVEQVQPGMTVLVAPGERIAVDGTVAGGQSDVDTSLITGETVPATVMAGTQVFAGTLNLSGALSLTATGVGESTLLAEIVRLMEVAEARRAGFVALADRVARWYAPVVHLLGAAAFLFWWLVMGAAWQDALLTAVAVLIITCPCALGLAVPAVQVIASGRLFRRGVLLKSGTALERLARVDTVVFDKTGTLTLGRPRLMNRDRVEDADLLAAAGIAAASRHPLARALVAAVGSNDPIAADGVEAVEEVPGRGLRRLTDAGEERLGSREFCADIHSSMADEVWMWGAGVADSGPGSELWLARPGRRPVRFEFEDTLRADAGETMAALRAAGLQIRLLSGDREPAVRAVAERLGIGHWEAGCTPAAKHAELEALAAAGHHVLMVGDGLNDAPALAAAHVSASPSTALDISQTAADAVFQGDGLMPVADLLATARRAEWLVRQNLAMAFTYNVVTVPLAMAGLVTPLIAAIAMSSSSLLVTGNALRLGAMRFRSRPSAVRSGPSVRDAQPAPLVPARS